MRAAIAAAATAQAKPMGEFSSSALIQLLRTFSILKASTSRFFITIIVSFFSSSFNSNIYSTLVFHHRQHHQNYTFQIYSYAEQRAWLHNKQATRLARRNMLRQAKRECCFGMI